MPLPNPTEMGVLKSMAEIGAAPVTVRNSTPARPTAPGFSLKTSARCETSTLSTTGSIPSWCSSSPVVTEFSSLDARELSARFAQKLRFGPAERVHQQPLHGRVPIVLSQIDPVGQHGTGLEVRVARACQPVERCDHADDDPVVVGADEVPDPVAGPALVGEDALADTLPVGMLEQTARVPALDPAARRHVPLAASDPAQPELQQAAPLLGAGQGSKVGTKALLVASHCSPRVVSFSLAPHCTDRVKGTTQLRLKR